MRDDGGEGVSCLRVLPTETGACGSARWRGTVRSPTEPPSSCESVCSRSLTRTAFTSVTYAD